MRTVYPSELDDQLPVIGSVMTALGSVIRQKILLLFEPEEPLNIKQIADQFNLSRTAVVHHINVLQDANILISERIGKEVILTVDWHIVLDVLDKVNTYVKDYGLPKEN